MPHPLVEQLRFTRAEWLRGLEGVSEEDGARHFGPMNSISWTVGHLAWHEQRSWLQRPQGLIPFPKLIETCAYGAPMSTPSLAEMKALWSKVTAQADPWLDALVQDDLQRQLLLDGREIGQRIGDILRRVTYHYWYHIGEIQATRQMLGQGDLPEYVGDLEETAPYRPE